MKSQPLLVVLEDVQRDLDLAQKHGIKLSWSETGELWYDTVSQRSILMATEFTAFGHSGAARLAMQDSNDCIQTLVKLADAIKRASARAV